MYLLDRDIIEQDRRKEDSYSGYSVVISENPRVVRTLTKSELNIFEDYDLIDIKKRVNQVKKALRDPRVHYKIINAYGFENLAEKHGGFAQEYEGEELNEHQFLRTFDDVCYKVDMSTGVMICLEGAAMITELFLTKVPSSWNLKSVDNIKTLRQPCNPFSLFDMRGVINIELTSTVESHGFVLYIEDDYITVMNTYGGYSEFFITKYNRNEWVMMFINFFDLDENEQFETYHKLWGFTPEMTKGILMEPTKIEYIDMLYTQIL